MYDGAELAKALLGLLSGLERVIPVVQWHSAELVEIPSSARVLASSPDCPIQAISYGEHAFGLQFHVEVTPAMVGARATVPAYELDREELGSRRRRTVRSRDPRRGVEHPRRRIDGLLELPERQLLPPAAAQRAAAIANHASTRTTQLYDRRGDEVDLDEIERILI